MFFFRFLLRDLLRLWYLISILCLFWRCLIIHFLHLLLFFQSYTINFHFWIFVNEVNHLYLLLLRLLYFTFLTVISDDFLELVKVTLISFGGKIHCSLLIRPRKYHNGFYMINLQNVRSFLAKNIQKENIFHCVLKLHILTACEIKGTSTIMW